MPSLFVSILIDQPAVGLQDLSVQINKQGVAMTITYTYQLHLQQGKTKQPCRFLFLLSEAGTGFTNSLI